MIHEQQSNNYADYLARLSQGLAVGLNDVAQHDIADSCSLDQVAMFTSGNLDKRFEKLTDQLELMADVVDDLDDWISKYVKSIPLAAYDTGASDGDRFIQWLTRETELNGEQRDVGNVIRCRNAVEDIGRTNRLAHVRFQELRSLSRELGAELGTNSSLSIHLNPIRLWTTFETNLLTGDEEDAVDEFANSISDDKPTEPANVLFYAFETEVRSAVFEREGQIVFRTLAEIERCHLDELNLRVDLAAGIDSEVIRDILLDSAEAGIVAFG
jgi:hypothetical protein